MQIFQENDDLRRVPVLLAGANCTGDEASLADCPGNGLNVDTVQCGLRQTATLLCYSILDPGAQPPVPTLPYCEMHVHDTYTVYVSSKVFATFNSEHGHTCFSLI